MTRLFIICCMLGISCLKAQVSKDPGAWDLLSAYNASTRIFYGEVVKILPEPNFKTGVMGVPVHRIDENELPMEEIVWFKAKKLSFKVSEHFKNAMPESFTAYLPDPDTRLWTHLINNAGDVFLAQPKAPDDLLLKLDPGDEGLFFIRYYLGSTIPVIHRVRFGQRAREDLAHLRAHQEANNQPLAQIMKIARVKEAADAAKKAAELKTFEDDYYKILQIRELEIRRSLLVDLIERMGFSDLWTYFTYKKRYLKEHGEHVDHDVIPPGPTEGKERLWHDASGELRKIEAILKARQ